MAIIEHEGQPSGETPEVHAPAAALFHGLADPTRLMILEHLRSGEHKVKELTDHLGLAQSTVSAHLSCLRDCGLVVSRPAGRASMYSLANAQLLFALLDDANHYIGLSSSHGLDTHDFAEIHGNESTLGATL